MKVFVLCCFWTTVVQWCISMTVCVYLNASEMFIFSCIFLITSNYWHRYLTQYQCFTTKHLWVLLWILLLVKVQCQMVKAFPGVWEQRLTCSQWVSEPVSQWLTRFPLLWLAVVCASWWIIPAASIALICHPVWEENNMWMWRGLVSEGEKRMKWKRKKWLEGRKQEPRNKMIKRKKNSLHLPEGRSWFLMTEAFCSSLASLGGAEGGGAQQEEHREEEEQIINMINTNHLNVLHLQKGLHDNTHTHTHARSRTHWVSISLLLANCQRVPKEDIIR